MCIRDRFFVELLQGNPKVLKASERLIEQEANAIASCLSFLELQRFGLKSAIGQADKLVESISQVCSIVWLDHNNLPMAAKLSRGLGIPSIDPLIFSGPLSRDARIIYRTDGCLEQYNTKGINIRNI